MKRRGATGQAETLDVPEFAGMLTGRDFKAKRRGG
jgi:hypothetical protein